MAFWRRSLVLMFLLPGFCLSQAAGLPPEKLLEAAHKAFEDNDYARAESQFAEFAVQFTNSARLPEAILWQALARLQQTNAAGAVELLANNQNRAGKWADQYLFWSGQAGAQKGDYAMAATNFTRLIQQYPASGLLLDAALGQATARARLGQWQAVIELLAQSNSVFQTKLRSLTSAVPAQASNGVYQPFLPSNSAGERALQGQLLLSEALLAQHNNTAARGALQSVTGLGLNPQLDWQRQYLLCQVDLADDRLRPALEGTTNLLALALKAADRALQAESAVFRANLFERQGLTNEAVSAYQSNLADGIPSRYQRQALLKITELALVRNRPLEAATMLETFSTRFPGAPDGDAALLGMGQLFLQEHRAGLCTNAVAAPGTNGFTGTNCLERAILKLQELTGKYPQSPLAGKAYLELGWCFWAAGRMGECQDSCQKAISRLPFSADQATAYLKLADAQFQQTNFVAALANYNLFTSKFAGLEEMKTNFFEPALYQAVQAAIGCGDLASATNAMASLIVWFPNGFHTGRAVLMTGQEIRRQRDPAGARAIFLDFISRITNSVLAPEIELAAARCYEEQGQFTNAVLLYDHWVVAFTNHPALPQAEFYRAHDTRLAGDETNAFLLFTNFCTRFSTNQLAPLARLCVADSDFNAGRFSDAEYGYQLIFQNPLWPKSEITCEAQMMAGRAAVAQQALGWTRARDYFSNVWASSECPADLRAEALIAYGDALLSLADSSGTNKIAAYSNAFLAFTAVGQLFPSNNAAVAVALGQRASTLFQWGAESPQHYDEASNFFQQLVLSTNASLPLRSMAKVGLARVLEQQAALLQASLSSRLSTPEEARAQRGALLEKALENCQDVFYGAIAWNDEQTDRYWTREAGLRAGKLAETLGKWQIAAKIYERLRTNFPSLRASMDKAIQRCQENFSSAER